MRRHMDTAMVEGMKRKSAATVNKMISAIQNKQTMDKEYLVDHMKNIDLRGKRYGLLKDAVISNFNMKDPNNCTFEFLHGDALNTVTTPAFKVLPVRGKYQKVFINMSASGNVLDDKGYKTFELKEDIRSFYTTFEYALIVNQFEFGKQQILPDAKSKAAVAKLYTNILVRYLNRKNSIMASEYGDVVFYMIINYFYNYILGEPLDLRTVSSFFEDDIVNVESDFEEYAETYKLKKNGTVYQYQNGFRDLFNMLKLIPILQNTAKNMSSFTNFTALVVMRYGYMFHLGLEYLPAFLAMVLAAKNGRITESKLILGDGTDMLMAITKIEKDLYRTIR